MDMPLQIDAIKQAPTVQAKYAALPFSKARVDRHIEHGRVALGDYVAAIMEMLNRVEVTKPICRRGFVRGDAEAYVTLDGRRRIAWEVASLERQEMLTIVFHVKIDDGGRGEAPRQASVMWSPTAAQTSLVSAEVDTGAVRELFVRSPWGDVWRRYGHCLDLWDWVADQAFAAEIIESMVTVRHAGPGAYQVDVADGSPFAFTWTPVDGRNLVSAAGGRMPDPSLLRSLFLREPTVTR